MGSSLKAQQIWNIRELSAEIRELTSKIKNYPQRCCGDRPGKTDLMLAVIGQAGYHQSEEIADTFGLPYDEQGMNEDEMDILQAAIKETGVRLLEDLRKQIALPPGFSFSMGYDQEGNYGLILNFQEAAEASPFIAHGRIPALSSGY